MAALGLIHHALVGRVGLAGEQQESSRSGLGEKQGQEQEQDQEKKQEK